MSIIGGNKAKIERTDFSDHPGRLFAKRSLMNAGDSLKPYGLEYQCSAAVHFYKVPGRDDYAFVIQQSGLPNIPEGQADVGFKELKRTMMEQFGREAPKERT